MGSFEACSVHKQGVVVSTPGSLWSNRRRRCTWALQHPVERLAALLVVAQPDRQGQLGKADRQRLALVRCRGGIGRGGSGRGTGGGQRRGVSSQFGPCGKFQYEILNTFKLYQVKFEG